MSHKDLVASIASSPEAHQVNRAEKMDRSLDKAASNIEQLRAHKKAILEATLAGEAVDTSEKYGYGKGHGRGLGD